MAVIDFAWAQIGEPSTPVVVEFAWAQIGASESRSVQFAWAQLQDTPIVVLPTAPSGVAGSAAGPGLYAITWADESGDELGFRVQIERPNGSGNWVDAVGSANPAAANAVQFNGSGLAASEVCRPRVQSFSAVGDSVWSYGAPFAADNPVTGGGTIPSFAVDADAAGAALTVTASLVAGGATGEENGAVTADAPGAAFTATATLVAGGAVGVLNADAPGFDFAILATLLAGGASGEIFTAEPPIGAAVGAVASLALWSDKDPRESCAVSFTFPGDVSEVVINVDVYSQYGLTDPDPESIFDGSFSVSGGTVTQRIRSGAGVSLVDYYIDCVAKVGADRLVAAGVLPVRTK